VTLPDLLKGGAATMAYATGNGARAGSRGRGCCPPVRCNKDRPDRSTPLLRDPCRLRPPDRCTPLLQALCMLHRPDRFTPLLQALCMLHRPDRCTPLLQALCMLHRPDRCTPLLQALCMHHRPDRYTCRLQAQCNKALRAPRTLCTVQVRGVSAPSRRRRHREPRAVAFQISYC